MSESLPSIELLEREKIPFRTVEFSSEKGTQNISKAIGAPLELILKTLVFQGRASGRVFVCLVRGTGKLDPEKLSKIAGEQVGMAMPGVVLSETGYRIGAIPAFGLKKPLRVLIEKSLEGEEILYVGSGRPGLDIILSAESLKKASLGTFEEIS